MATDLKKDTDVIIDVENVKSLIEYTIAMGSQAYMTELTLKDELVKIGNHTVKLRDAIVRRTDAIDERLDSIENKLDDIGQQLEIVTKQRHESDENLVNALKYITDKILEHDMNIHALRNKQ